MKKYRSCLLWPLLRVHFYENSVCMNLCFSSPVNLSVSISLVIHLQELKRRMFPPPWQLVSQPGDWPDCHPKTATAENPGTHNKDQLVAQRVKNLPERQETWVQFLGWEDILGEEMVTLSSILAWRIPWTEEPGYSLWDHEESDTLSNSHTHTQVSAYKVWLRGKWWEFPFSLLFRFTGGFGASSLWHRASTIW